jgi:hypothetical protein
MRATRLLAFALALLVSVLGGIAAAAAQAPSPGPAKAPPNRLKPGAVGPIVFYVAHGAAAACGHGCNAWIAAEGEIDAAAAQRLRRLLTKPDRRKLTIFFDSPGGSVAGSIELGRLIRDQKLTASVARTVPRGCGHDNPPDKSCEALKKSGQELEAQFDPDGAICNSGCVYALAGGAVRLVPPGARLGIHDVGVDPAKKMSNAALAEGNRIARAHLQDYLRDLGFDKTLLAAATEVPNDTIRYIKRDEVARFGIDRRGFGEAVWHFSVNFWAMYKRFFVRTETGDQPGYRDGFVSLRCGPPQQVKIAFALENDRNNKSSTLPSIRIGLNGQNIDLASKTPESGYDIRSTLIPAGMLASVAADAVIEVSGIDHGIAEGLKGSLTLPMDGFSAAYKEMRKNCDESAPAAVAANPVTPSGPSRPASLQMVQLTLTTATEEKLRLDTIQQDCTNGPMTVSILQYPRHGALTIENNQADSCNPDGTLIFYKPSSGYIGADSITLNIEYRSGVASTRRYTIEVTAPVRPASADQTIQ